MTLERKKVEPVWEQATIDQLWVTTQIEAMIESGPSPAAAKPPGASPEAQKAKEPATK